MLDLFTILTRGGVVVWSKTFAPIQGNPINNLIDQVLIGEHGYSDKQRYTTGPYELQWATANDYNLVFVIVKQKFCSLYGERIQSHDWSAIDFDSEFLDVLDALESQSEKGLKVKAESPSSKKSTTKKEKRVWDDSKITSERMKEFDYSGTADEVSTGDQLDHLVDSTAMGQRSADGQYSVQDLERPSQSDDDEDDDTDGNQPATSATGRLVSFFQSLTGRKALQESDLTPVMERMREHLMAKNVASDIADHICSSVGQSLLSMPASALGGTGMFSSTQKAVRSAMETTLQRILTPHTPVDLLRDIESARISNRPYSIVFVGVNGVGKSTNLSKVCFWLLQNKLKVLIAACDTFRSGAVEQLRVHAHNLKALSDNAVVDIFERGYGKDSAGIAKDAITYAKNNQYDVVLVDTAGRMQDNEPLMRALAKLVSVNDPDKIIFVGEALVGNEAVDQLKKFNQALKDFSGLARPRHIDGIILTKFDTIDDKVGAALSMTYTTGQPILFVGTGQTYTDLKNMKISHVVQSLLSN
ncbi:hypothetical protein H4R33_003978 [Dimargaris cristalligena]|nr:hypothetical protein H4R33_003978 [Dimargaris cristalligena]